MKKIELVFVPCPEMGHLLSTVEVAKLILNRHPRISVVILIINLPFDDPVVNSYVDSQSREADPRITFISLPALANPPDLASSNFFSTLVELQKPLIKQAVLDRVESGSPMPAAFILDMLCSALIDVANELRVPPYLFCTSGANFLNLMFHLLSLADHDGVHIADEFCNPDKEIDVPGFRNRVPGKVIPGIFLDKEGGGAEMVFNIVRRFRESKGILVNTFVELESFGTQALLEQAEDNKIPNVSKKEDQNSMIEWLDMQPHSSVVFLCFRSVGCFREKEVKELANGLERVGH